MICQFLSGPAEITNPSRWTIPLPAGLGREIITFTLKQVCRFLFSMYLLASEALGCAKKSGRD